MAGEERSFFLLSCFFFVSFFLFLGRCHDQNQGLERAMLAPRKEVKCVLGSTQ